MTDERGVIGVISLSGLERELAKDGKKKLCETVDPLTFPHVHSDQTLDMALQRMGVNQVDILPVVGRADVHELKGHRYSWRRTERVWSRPIRIKFADEFRRCAEIISR